MVVRDGMLLAGLGVALGLLGAPAVTRVMAGQLCGVTATDTGTFVGVPIVLIVTAFVLLPPSVRHEWIPWWRSERNGRSGRSGRSRRTGS